MLLHCDVVSPPLARSLESSNVGGNPSLRLVAYVRIDIFRVDIDLVGIEEKTSAISTGERSVEGMHQLIQGRQGTRIRSSVR